MASIWGIINNSYKLLLCAKIFEAVTFPPCINTARKLFIISILQFRKQGIKLFVQGDS